MTTIVQVGDSLIPFIFSGAAQSNDIMLPPRTARGLVVVLTGSWATANIGFAFGFGGVLTFFPLYDKSGALVKITGVSQGEILTAPAELWAMGPFRALRLLSRNTSNDATTVNQTTNGMIGFLY